LTDTSYKTRWVDSTETVSENPYKAPESDPTNTDQGEQSQQFYVVSKTKYAVLFIATLGLYAYFWLFYNWHKHKRATRASIWPLPRALFSIFFTHSLIFAIDRRLKDNQIDHKWNPPFWATMYVVSIVLSFVLSALASYLLKSDISAMVADLLMVVVHFYILLQVQIAINVSHNDPFGMTNHKFTALNFFWILLGFIFWAITLVYMGDALGLVDIDAMLTS